MPNGRRPPSRLHNLNGSGPGTQQPAPVSSGRIAQRQPRQEFDPARVPAGYDPGYWHMALLFRDLAMADDINLRAGVPVIYAEIMRIFAWFDLEHGSRPFRRRGDGKVERTYAQMYRDGTGRQIAWRDVGEAIVREFWSRRWDDQALSYFCDMDILQQMAHYVCNHWENERFRRQREAHPRPAPEVRQWHRPQKEAR